MLIRGLGSSTNALAGQPLTDFAFADSFGLADFFVLLFDRLVPSIGKHVASRVAICAVDETGGLETDAEDNVDSTAACPSLFV